MSEQKLEKMSVDSVKVSSDTSYIHLIDSETNVNDVNQSETVNSKVNITTEVQDEIKEVQTCDTHEYCLDKCPKECPSDVNCQKEKCCVNKEETKDDVEDTSEHSRESKEAICAKSHIINIDDVKIPETQSESVEPINLRNANLEREDSIINNQIIKIDKNINKKYRYIKYKSVNLLKNMMISKKNFMNLLIQIMEMIDAEEELTGKEKANYVINLCKYLIVRYNIFYQDEYDILFKLLPDAINIICLVSKKKMHVVKNVSDKIRKKKELSVITYTIYEKIQEYMVDDKYTVDTLEKKAPTIIMELIKYSYDYAYLRSDEKKNVAIKVSQLILSNLSKLFESATSENIKKLQIVFDCLESFIDVVLNIEKGKYYINVNPSNGIFTINRSQPILLPKKKKPFWVCCS